MGQEEVSSVLPLPSASASPPPQKKLSQLALLKHGAQSRTRKALAKGVPPHPSREETKQELAKLRVATALLELCWASGTTEGMRRWGAIDTAPTCPSAHGRPPSSFALTALLSSHPRSAQATGPPLHPRMLTIKAMISHKEKTPVACSV